MDFVGQAMGLASPALLFLIIPLLLLLFSKIVSRQPERRLPYPPGPKGLPVLGNMLMKDQLTHRGLAQLAKQYGGLFHLRLGFTHMVVVSTPEMARQVVQVQDHIFSNRPATMAIIYLTYNRSGLSFAHHGPFWRQMRKVCAMRIFSRQRTASWKSIRDEVESMIQVVASSTGSPINIADLAFALTRNIIYRAAFGSSSHEHQDKFMAIFKEYSVLFGAFSIADFIPWFRWFNPQGINKRHVNARQSLDSFIDQIINDHIEKKKIRKVTDEHENDMVDELLAFYDEDAKVRGGSHELQNSIKVTRENIKCVIMDIMFGGTETVATTMEWAMAELMRSPEDMKRVQQEVVDVVGLKRRVRESDIEKLTYMKCVIKETLRLHPPIPLFPHESAEDAEIAGYCIPARARVMVNAWAIGRDADSWESPETFKPSRFLNEGAPDFKGSNFDYIPFGSGRRSCPGMPLGVYTLELGLAHLLHCFTWELPDGMKPSELNMDYEFGITIPRAVPLVALPTPRLLCPISQD